MNTLAKGISIIFHPLLLTTYLVLVLGYFMPEMLRLQTSQLLPFALVVVIITFILPGVNLLILKFFGNIKSLTMVTRQDRYVPFIMISVFYVAATIIFYTMQRVSPNFTKLLMIVSALVVTATIITFFFKISVHALAMWGSIGILLPLNKLTLGQLIMPTVLVIIIAGLVMSARLYLQAHTPREILYGSAVGFGLSFLLMNILF
jgi:membrane-associated phospholipid phosphatase